jgi:hypothetical protein
LDHDSEEESKLPQVIHPESGLAESESDVAEFLHRVLQAGLKMLTGLCSYLEAVRNDFLSSSLVDRTHFFVTKVAEVLLDVSQVLLFEASSYSHVLARWLLHFSNRKTSPITFPLRFKFRSLVFL